MKLFSKQEILVSIQPILRRHAIQRASLFGSYARDEQTENSDVDIVIEPPANISLLGLIGVQFELEKALDKKVDLATFRGLSPYLRPYVEKDLVAI